MQSHILIFLLYLTLPSLRGVWFYFCCCSCFSFLLSLFAVHTGQTALNIADREGFVALLQPCSSGGCPSAAPAPAINNQDLNSMSLCWSGSLRTQALSFSVTSAFLMYFSLILEHIHQPELPFNVILGRLFKTSRVSSENCGRNWGFKLPQTSC